jgi:hypothetical protein
MPLKVVVSVDASRTKVTKKLLISIDTTMVVQQLEISPVTSTLLQTFLKEELVKNVVKSTFYRLR